MELSIKLHPVNRFPLGGILVKSPSVACWLQELQRMRLSLASTEVYAIPGTAANTIWGALILPSGEMPKDLIGKNEWCQRLHPNLLIPERAILHPPMTDAELTNLLQRGKHVFHPEFGLVELTGPLLPEAFVRPPEIRESTITAPYKSAFIPTEIRSFQVHAVSPEEALKRLEENVVPEPKQFDDKPLNLGEKIKLGFYKALFSLGGKTAGSGSGTGASEGSGGGIAGSPKEMPQWLSKLGSLFGSFGQKTAERMQRSMEDLERRNQKKLDRLMELFKNNPEEALKYAIPLDEGGTNRGGLGGELDLSRRWGDFSLGGSGRFSPGGGSVDIGDYYFQLQNQYRETARQLMERGEYQKAAFIYLKLLKETHKAAEALEQGSLYEEAAALYLQNNQKLKAAECYEKGNRTNQAIGLYTELQEFEKAGDLYARTGRKPEAQQQYQVVVDNHVKYSRYLKAAELKSGKMGNPSGGQELLLEGWRANSEQISCMNTYFSNIRDEKQLKSAIEQVYAREVSYGNEAAFLKVMKNEYDKEHAFNPAIRDIAYTIVASQLHANPGVVSELRAFNKEDKELAKDTLRFTSGKRKR